MTSIGTCRFIQTSWKLNAQKSIHSTAHDFSIRKISVPEVDKLALRVISSNVFTRHQRSGNFYVRRIESLADTTIIELFGTGSIQQVENKGKAFAPLIEHVALGCAILALTREDFLRSLSISNHLRSGYYITIGPGYKSFRSKSKSQPSLKGIVINKAFANRFSRYKFDNIISLASNRGNLSKKAISSLDWLIQSRMEPDTKSSIIKGAIALETLLIFNSSEPLMKSLSERCSFLLSSNPATRKQISGVIKKYYNLRSSIVHGSLSNRISATDKLLEGISRLTILLVLIIAANIDRWQSTNDLSEWCENEKWGSPSNNVVLPFSEKYVLKQIQMCS